MGAFASSAHSQTPEVAAEPPVVANSTLSAELFYELLIGEISLRSGEPATGFAIMLDAARKTNDAALYERAVEIAMQSRSGEAALQAARAWKAAQPPSREANRHVLTILLALNRVAETTEVLRADIALADPRERAAVIAGVPRLYARVSDKKAALAATESALAAYLTQSATSAVAYTAAGRMRLAAGNVAGALEAATRGQAADANAVGPAVLALEIMEPKQPLAEPIVRKYLESPTAPAEVRMGYARALLDAQRYAEATEQLQTVTQTRADYPEAWLVLGALQLQDNQLASAETALKRYVELAPQQSPEERTRGLAQAYLNLSQIAEKRKDFPLAEAWLNKIENAQDMVSAQSRRASILAKQGRMDEARKLLQALPARNPEETRLRVSAEAQLLREHKQYQAAYDLLTEAVAKAPQDADLLYDQAMMAEKLDRLTEMEKLLRQLIALKPDHHHAYNALGYSLAERNIRLPEAKQLIQKALEYAPGDPFISDSLGWVEFRLGNKAEALRILEAAYKQKPDTEIAAHLGEVLLSLGQRERAIAIWKEGSLVDAANETLQETLKRLKIKW